MCSFSPNKEPLYLPFSASGTDTRGDTSNMFKIQWFFIRANLLVSLNVEKISRLRPAWKGNRSPEGITQNVQSDEVEPNRDVISLGHKWP